MSETKNEAPREWNAWQIKPFAVGAFCDLIEAQGWKVRAVVSGVGPEAGILAERIRPEQGHEQAGA